MISCQDVSHGMDPRGPRLAMGVLVVTFLARSPVYQYPVKTKSFFTIKPKLKVAFQHKYLISYHDSVKVKAFECP